MAKKEKSSIKKSPDLDKKHKLDAGAENSKEDVKPTNVKNPKDDEPSWYHYVIVLIVFFLIGAVIYNGYNYFHPANTTNISTQTYNYAYKVGNDTFNIKYNYPLSVLKNNNYTIQPTKLDVLNTVNFTRSFYVYNGTANGQVAITAIKVRNFLTYVYGESFSDKVHYYNDTNCSNSTLKSKVMMFNVTGDRNGVFYNKTNGCITFETTSPKNFVLLGDKFIYSLTQQ